MSRPTNDTPESRKQVHLNLRKAFSLINKSIKDEIYIAAYVTAFSIIEDRVFSMFVVAKRVETRKKEIKKNPRVGFVVYVNYLSETKTIPKAIANKLISEADTRNKLLHGAMWRLDEFNKRTTDRVVNLAKELNILRTEQRKLYGIGYKI
jgi:hypothetical protein